MKRKVFGLQQLTYLFYEQGLKLKKQIKKALEWALNKLEPKPEPKEIAVWPFPAPKITKPKHKLLIPKATTRSKAKLVVKKTAAKKTIKKAK